jgi:hypothetical protein
MKKLHIFTTKQQQGRRICSDDADLHSSLAKTKYTLQKKSEATAGTPGTAGMPVICS